MSSGEPTLVRAANLWLAFALLCGPLVLLAAMPVVGSAAAVAAAALASAGVAACALWVVPDLDPDAVWALGVLALVVFLALRWAVGRAGLHLESPAVSAVVWIAAVACSFAALAYRRTRSRGTDRD